MTVQSRTEVSIEELVTWKSHEPDKTVKVSNKDDYDFLMEFLERKGFKWFGGQLPTEYEAWTGEDSVIRIILIKNRKLDSKYSIRTDIESLHSDEPAYILSNMRVYGLIPAIKIREQDNPFKDMGLIKTVTAKKINEDVLKIGSVLRTRIEGRIYNHIVTEIREDEIVAFNGVFHRRIPMSTLESSEHIAEHIPEGAVDLVM